MKSSLKKLLQPQRDLTAIAGKRMPLFLNCNVISVVRQAVDIGVERCLGFVSSYLQRR